MSFSQNYRDFVAEQLGRVAPVTAKSMFGGVGLYARGSFFALIADDRLYFKVDDSNRPDFAALGMEPFRPFGEENAMGYHEVPVGVLEDPTELGVWMNKALAVAARAKSGQIARERPRAPRLPTRPAKPTTSKRTHKTVRRSGLILLLAAGCAGCQPNAEKPVPQAFPAVDPHAAIPPVADADPTRRHPISVRVPATMMVARSGDSLEVSFPSLQTLKLTAGHHLITGMTWEEKISQAGVAKSLGGGMQSGLESEFNPHLLAAGQNVLPAPGQEFTYEQRITIFETDLPAQHFWSPRDGKHFRVLWTHTFEAIIK